MLLFPIAGALLEDSVPESHVDEPGAEEADEEAELADSQAPRSDPPSKPLSKGLLYLFVFC